MAKKYSKQEISDLLGQVKDRAEVLRTEQNTGSVTRPPAARGDDFAEGASGDSSLTNMSIPTTPRSLSELRSATFSLAGGQSMTASDMNRAASRLSGINSTNTGSNTTQSQSVSSAGSRSSRTNIGQRTPKDFSMEGVKDGDKTITGENGFESMGVEQKKLIKERLDAVAARLKVLAEQDKTSAATAAVSDTPIVQEEEAAISTLNDKGSITSGALELLRSQEDILQKQLTAEIQSINNSFNVAETGMKAEQAREAGSTSAGLAAAGGYLGFSGSGTGVMLSLTKSHRAEMQDLALRREQAISEARAAAANKEMDIVREKAREIQRIEEVAYERQKAYNKEIKAAADKQKEESKRQQTQTDIFNAIQSGSRSAKEIFNALGGKVDIKTISDFLTNAGKGSGVGFSFSASNVASLMGTGMSATDINAFNDYVNENGYDETVRSAMTPSQRIAADKIFKQVSDTTGKANPKDQMSILDLNRVEENYGLRFPPGVSAGVVNQFIQDNWGLPVAEQQAAIDALFGKQEGASGSTGASIDFTQDYFTQNYTQAQLKTIADIVGASKWYTGKTTDINRMFSDPAFLTSFQNKVKSAAKAFGISEQAALEQLIGV